MGYATLRKYVSVLLEIDELEEKISQLTDKQKYPRIQLISDMPKGEGTFDQMVNYVIDVDNQREKIKTLQQSVAHIDACLTDREKKLVRCYYVDCMAWKAVANEIHCSERHVFRIHKNIIEKLKKLS